jgi:hypothetical protein
MRPLDTSLRDSIFWRNTMWWHDLLWGVWNGITAWIVLIVHVFGGWDGQAVYDPERKGNWYDLGFLIPASVSILS